VGLGLGLRLGLGSWLGLGPGFRLLKRLGLGGRHQRGTGLACQVGGELGKLQVIAGSRAAGRDRAGG